MTARATDTWLTPPAIIAALGPFDLDPACPPQMPWRTAARCFTPADNGLLQRWAGRVWGNFPYSNISPWLARLADHGIGTAMVFSKTETEWFFAHVWRRASALLFLEGRVRFYLPSGEQSRKDAGSPSVLVAYGRHDADRLADSGLAGAFVPLACTGQLIAVLRPVGGDTWDACIAAIFRRLGGRATVRMVLTAISDHPKAATNNNLDAKIRQVCQGPRYERIARGEYQLRGVA